MSDALLLRPAEATELLGLGRSKTYELIARGVIPSIRIGRSVRVPRAALLAWIDARTASAAGVEPSDGSR